MTDKQITVDKLKNDVACKENIINHLAEHNIKLQAQLKCKEQECEELKKQVEVIKERLFRKIAPIDYTDCPYYIKMVKLKQALAEIKYIAEENIRIADLEGLSGVYRRGLAEQILQKISECEVENDR